MMEIKFRQWIKESKSFLYWGFMEKGNFASPEFNLSTHEGALKHSQQFTGRKDKNGKEIYEGDVVKGGKIIKFGDYNPDDSYYGCPCAFVAGNDLNNGLNDEMEVIGNIYENPKLTLSTGGKDVG